MRINSNLTASGADITTARQLSANFSVAFMGDTKGGNFDIPEKQAMSMLTDPNPHSQPNSDVVVPWINGLDVTRRLRDIFIIDFGRGTLESEASNYAAPFRHVVLIVKPQRDQSRTTVGLYWQHSVKKRARDAAERALRRKMRQVVVVLGVSIRPGDARWLDFGLNRPLRSLGERAPVARPATELPSIEEIAPLQAIAVEAAAA